MHIAEGVLSAPVLLAGAAVAVAGTAVGLRKMEGERVMTVALMSAAFFVASLIHVNVGPAGVHLVLNGLTGVILGWAAFPAILAGLLLQSLLFQFGGLTALGVNTATMALPAVIAWYLARPLLRGGGTARAVGAFLCGAGAILCSGLLTACALALSGDGFLVTAKALLIAHLPLMAIEGVVTLFAYSFLAKVKPQILELPGRA